MPLKKISLALLLALLIPACSEKPPVPEEKFADFYIGLQMIDTQFGSDSALQAQKIDSLRKVSGIDKGLFDSTMAWYGRRPERWNEFFADVKRKLAEMKPAYVKPKRP